MKTITFLLLIVLTFSPIFALDYQTQTVAEVIASEAANQGEIGMRVV